MNFRTCFQRWWAAAAAAVITGGRPVWARVTWATQQPPDWPAPLPGTTGWTAPDLTAPAQRTTPLLAASSQSWGYFFLSFSPRDAGHHLNRSLTHRRHPLLNGWLVRVMALQSLPFWHLSKPVFYTISSDCVIASKIKKREIYDGVIHFLLSDFRQVADESQQQLQQQRLRRTSMRRMVRFRMSSSSSSADVDPIVAAPPGKHAAHVAPSSPPCGSSSSRLCRFNAGQRSPKVALGYHMKMEVNK